VRTPFHSGQGRVVWECPSWGSFSFGELGPASAGLSCLDHKKKPRRRAGQSPSQEGGRGNLSFDTPTRERRLGSRKLIRPYKMDIGLVAFPFEEFHLVITRERSRPRRSPSVSSATLQATRTILGLTSGARERRHRERDSQPGVAAHLAGRRCLRKGRRGGPTAAPLVSLPRVSPHAEGYKPTG
jgi:hypothetical protein